MQWGALSQVGGEWPGAAGAAVIDTNFEIRWKKRHWSLMQSISTSMCVWMNLRLAQLLLFSAWLVFFFFIFCLKILLLCSYWVACNCRNATQQQTPNSNSCEYICEFVATLLTHIFGHAKIGQYVNVHIHTYPISSFLYIHIYVCVYKKSGFLFSSQCQWGFYIHVVDLFFPLF